MIQVLSGCLWVCVGFGSLGLLHGFLICACVAVVFVSLWVWCDVGLQFGCFWGFAVWVFLGFRSLGVSGWWFSAGGVCLQGSWFWRALGVLPACFDCLWVGVI